MEKFKDIIYEISDLIFGFIVLAFIVVISTYQLHGWFNISMPKNLDQIIIATNSKDIIKEPEISNSTETTIPENKIDKPESDSITNDNKEMNESQSSDIKTDIKEPADIDKIVSIRNISIASGSSSEKVANALYENNIINSKKEFISRLLELNVATKIKAGDFKIPSNSNLDEVIKIITQ